MQKKAIKIIGVAAILGIMLVSGAFVVYHNVAAQTPQPNTPTNPGLGRGMGGGFMGGESEQELATALGIDLTQLQAAYKTANTEALKEAVSKGLITQAQADEITARGLDQRPVGNFDKSGADGVDYNALLAKALNISTDKLQAARLQAFNTNIDAAVKAGKMTQEQADLAKGRNALFSSSKFQASMQSAFTAAVNQGVTDGIITQAQADQLLKSGAGKGMMGGFGGPGMMGDFRGPGGMGRNGQLKGKGGRGASPAAPTTVPSSGA